MTNDRDIERLLDHWFTERPIQVADRVFDGVEDRIARQHQRPAWGFHWRHFEMNSAIKIGAAIAAVLVLAVAGWNLLPGRSRPAVGATPSPSPTASSSPSAAPSVGVVFPTWYTDEGNGAGILSAGSQTTTSFMPGFTYTVPEGWVNAGDEAGFYGLFPDTPANQAEFGRSGGLAHRSSWGRRTTRTSPATRGKTIRARRRPRSSPPWRTTKHLRRSEPVDVTIGGLTGKQIDVQLDPGWTESCPGDPPGFDLADGRTRAILLDTPDRGVIVIFVGSLQSAGHEAFVAEAMPIIESFQFDLTP